MKFHPQLVIKCCIGSKSMDCLNFNAQGDPTTPPITGLCKPAADNKISTADVAM
jgi:hypothetical protein